MLLEEVESSHSGDDILQLNNDEDDEAATTGKYFDEGVMMEDFIDIGADEEEEQESNKAKGKRSKQNPVIGNKVI